MWCLAENSDEEMEGPAQVDMGGVAEHRGLSAFALTFRVEEGVVSMWPEVIAVLASAHTMSYRFVDSRSKGFSHRIICSHLHSC